MEIIELIQISDYLEYPELVDLNSIVDIEGKKYIPFLEFENSLKERVKNVTFEGLQNPETKFPILDFLGWDGNIYFKKENDNWVYDRFEATSKEPRELNFI